MLTESCPHTRAHSRLLLAEVTSLDKFNNKFNSMRISGAEFFVVPDEIILATDSNNEAKHNISTIQESMLALLETIPRRRYAECCKELPVSASSRCLTSTAVVGWFSTAQHKISKHVI